VEMTLSSSLASEVTRATNAENGKEIGRASCRGREMITVGAQVLAESATGYPSLNIPNGEAAPRSPANGDLWLLRGDPNLQFQSMSNGTQMLAFYSDITTATSGQTTALNNEIARATAAENTLTTSLAGEVTRATGVEMTLSSSLASEVTRATNAENGK